VSKGKQAPAAGQSTAWVEHSRGVDGKSKAGTKGGEPGVGVDETQKKKGARGPVSAE